MGEVASEYGMSMAELNAEISRDNDIWVDQKGKLFYACESLHDYDGGRHHHHHHHHHRSVLQEVENSPASRSLLAQPSIASGNAFNLHSRPGAALVIYLDFTGTVVDDAWWIESYLGTTGSITCPPYDIDNNPGVFSTTEKDRIIKIWQTVAEDFAPWDVDVTTVDPGIEALRRIDSGDINYGMRVIFGACAEIKNKCGCGGIAYLSTFSANVDRPVFVFNTGASGAAEAASHEVGHALGLSHDGTSSVGYYTGHGSGNNGWAPIMGVGYYQTVVQWSKGEYADANQKQDDIVKISSYIPLRPDDHGSSPATATPLFPSSFGSVSVSTEGVISTAGHLTTSRLIMPVVLFLLA